jgi:hypothetical protein
VPGKTNKNIKRTQKYYIVTYYFFVIFYDVRKFSMQFKDAFTNCLMRKEEKNYIVKFIKTYGISKILILVP